MRLDWTRVTDFIASRAPDLAASFVGASRRDVEIAQERSGLVFPSSYASFLVTMGEDSSGLHPFGDSQVHALSDLMAQWPPEDPIPKQFFKIAYESDQFAVAFLDTYLDVSRSDGHDAPIVTFETPVSGRVDFPQESLSFAETVLYRIFWMLEVSVRAFGARIVIFNSRDWGGAKEKDAPAALLTQAGFEFALPELPRVACLSQASASALLSVSDTGRLVAVDLGADNREAVEKLVDELLKRFPDAELQDPPARRNESEA
jgi:hypothetical protein